MGLKHAMKRSIRAALLRTGRRMGGRGRQAIRSAHSYLDLGAWAASEAGGIPDDVGNKERLFRVAVEQVDGARQPLYLEFGVYKGASLRWWSENLRGDAARLIGFDSFEGLPEDWNMGRGRGAFAVDQVPQFDDPRVSLEVGWFDKTVPAFEVPDHDRLVVNVDADLYSSAVLVLDHLDPYLVPGVLLYFDELNDRDHELRALKEYLSRTGKKVRALGSSGARTNWLLEVVA